MLLLLAGPLLLIVVVPHLIVGQINLFKNYSYLIGPCAKKEKKTT